MNKTAIFLALLKQSSIPAPIAEHRFHETRKWRFDWSWPDYKVALEVDGGLFSGGRHSRGAGIIKEHEKFNNAACMGWRILRCTPQQLCTTDVIATIKAALGV